MSRSRRVRLWLAASRSSSSIITVAIVGILAAAVLPLAEVTMQRAKESELRTALRQVREAIDAYKQASDEGRVAKKAGESGYPKSLDVLLTASRTPRI